MEAVVEKVTLYDVLGYGFPGFLMLFILLTDFINVIPDTTINLVKDQSGIFVVAVIVVSHIVGVLLSESSKTVLLLKGLIVQKIPALGTPSQLLSKFKKWLGLTPGPASQDKKAIFLEKTLESVNKEDLQTALLNSGSSYDINDERAADYIYSVIQVDPEFSRIHSYASAKVFSRNSAMACLIGGVLNLALCVLRWLKWFDNGYRCRFQLLAAIVLFACSLLMFERSITFGKKKIFYACNWFIFKYNNQVKQNKSIEK